MTGLGLGMASLSINTTRIRHPNVQFPELTFKPIKIPFHSSLFLTKSPTKTLALRPCSVSESSVSLPVGAESLDDDPTAELSYLDSETDPKSEKQNKDTYYQDLARNWRPETKRCAAMAMATAMATKLRFLPSYEHRFMSTPPSSKPWRSSPTKFMINIKSQSQSLQLKASSKKKRRPENVDGEFFVDHTCIDCDTCRWMAPEVFTRVDGMSAVSKQPSCQDEHLKALQALLSCPTSSIHTEKPVHDILEVHKTFPIPIDMERIPGVYHCGYHSEKSYGAASYLIVHPEGNILIDSPRYTERLACNIEKMGGARYMFLTHKDDVADHKKWSERLGCERILHSTEVEPSTSNVETKLNGCGPWSLNDDIQLIHTPGHSEGSVCLLYKPLKVLFTGDHLALGESGLDIFEQYNYCSVSQQLDSVAMLLELEFEWMIPGHGRKAVYKDVEEKNSSIKAFLTAKQHTGYFKLGI